MEHFIGDNQLVIFMQNKYICSQKYSLLNGLYKVLLLVFENIYMHRNFTTIIFRVHPIEEAIMQWTPIEFYIHRLNFL